MDDINKILEQHEIWLKDNKKGKRAVFLDRDLRMLKSPVNLSNAILAEVDMRGCNLQYSNFEGACIVKSNLKGADMTTANMCGARIEYTNMSDVTLTYAHMTEAQLDTVDLTNANLHNAYLRGCELVLTNLKDADLSDSCIRDTIFKLCNLEGCDIRNAYGDTGSIKTTKIDDIKVCMMVNSIAIYDYQYTVDEWRSFTDEDIKRLEGISSSWWNMTKDRVFKMYEDNWGKNKK